MLYDLDRHPFEAAPLTQLFHVLTKRKPSWWSESAASAGDVPRAAAAPEDLTLVGGSSQDASRRSPSPPGAAVATANTSCTTSVDPSARSSSVAAISIPDTVVWENNIPKGWFYFDAKEGRVVRRKVETQALEGIFLKGVLDPETVVATVYTIDGTREDGTPGIGFDFLNTKAFRDYVFVVNRSRAKGTSILQRFVTPLNSAQNDMIHVVWSQSVVQVSRRQNIHQLSDVRIPAALRCPTFEGVTHLSRLMHSTARLKQQVQRAAQKLADFFSETDAKFRLVRLSAYYKMDHQSRLQLLYAPSVRIVRLADPIAGVIGSSAASGGGNSLISAAGFHRRHRVCLDLALDYAMPSTSGAPVEASKALTRARRSPPSPAVVPEAASGGHKSGVVSIQNDDVKFAERWMNQRDPRRRQRPPPASDAGRPIVAQGGSNVGSNSPDSVSPSFGTIRRAMSLRSTTSLGDGAEEAADTSPRAAALSRSAQRFSSMRSSSSFVSRRPGSGGGLNVKRGTSFAAAPPLLGVTPAVFSAIRHVLDATTTPDPRMLDTLQKVEERYGHDTLRAAALQLHGSAIDDGSAMELCFLRLRLDGDAAGGGRGSPVRRPSSAAAALTLPPSVSGATTATAGMPRPKSRLSLADQVAAVIADWVYQLPTTTTDPTVSYPSIVSRQDVEVSIQRGQSQRISDAPLTCDKYFVIEFPLVTGPRPPQSALDWFRALAPTRCEHGDGASYVGGGSRLVGRNPVGTDDSGVPTTVDDAAGALLECRGIGFGCVEELAAFIVGAALAAHNESTEATTEDRLDRHGDVIGVAEGCVPFTFVARPAASQIWLLVGVSTRRREMVAGAAPPSSSSRLRSPPPPPAEPPALSLHLSAQLSHLVLARFFPTMRPFLDDVNARVALIRPPPTTVAAAEQPIPHRHLLTADAARPRRRSSSVTMLEADAPSGNSPPGPTAVDVTAAHRATPAIDQRPTAVAAPPQPTPAQASHGGDDDYEDGFEEELAED